MALRLQRALESAQQALAAAEARRQHAERSLLIARAMEDRVRRTIRQIEAAMAELHQPAGCDR